jgi:anti-sigma B factor antagonist
MAGSEARAMVHDGVVGRVVCGDDVVYVALAGELDLYTADAVAEALALACASRPSKVVVDLRGVEFLDSTTLHVFRRARKQLRNWRGLQLVGPQPAVRRALEVSGVESVLAAVADEGEECFEPASDATAGARRASGAGQASPSERA